MKHKKYSFELVGKFESSVESTNQNETHHIDMSTDHLPSFLSGVVLLLLRFSHGEQTSCEI